MSKADEKTKILETIVASGDPLLATLADAILNDSVQERLFALAVSLADDAEGAEKIMNALMEIDRRLGFVGEGGSLVAMSHGALAVHLISHQREIRALELAERRFASSLPIVELARRSFLTIFVGVHEDAVLQELVDRVVGLVAQGRVRKLIVVLEDVLRLEEPALSTLREELRLHDVTLEVKTPVAF